MEHWSDTYLNWSGDFETLVKTANTVLKGLTPPLDDVTESLVRHYQSKNLVGRGVKRGRQAYFGLSDLQAVVETKRLAQDGWGLDKVAQIYQTSFILDENVGSTRAMDVVQGLMKKSAQAPLSTSPLYTSAPAFSGVSGGMPTQTTLLRSSSRHAFAKSDALSNAMGVSQSLALGSAEMPVLDSLQETASALYSASQSTSNVRHALQPAPWLTAYIDPRQLELASLEDIQKACDALKDWCQTQKWVSSSRSS